MTSTKELEELFPGIKVMTIDVGDRVICDLCNTEYTNSDAVGGVLFSHKACCPICAPEMIKNAKKFKETRFLELPTVGETFRDFVLRIRKR